MGMAEIMRSRTVRVGMVAAVAAAAVGGTTLAASASTDANGVPLTVGDLVWRDDNSNGVQDAGEPGIPGVRIQVAVGERHEWTYDAVTDANGRWKTTDMEMLGWVCVNVDGASFPAGLEVTKSKVGSDATDSDFGATQWGASTCKFVAGNPHLDIDLGLRPKTAPVPVTSNIGDRVWHDTNGNGLQDAGEAGLGGVTLRLTAASTGALLGTATTAADGSYNIAVVDRPVDHLCIAVDPATIPAGLVQVPSVQGNNTPIGDLTCFGFAGTEYKDADLGFKPIAPAPVTPGKIGDQAFRDANRNGRKDAGEAGVPGVKVAVVANGSVLTTKTTTSGGWYGANVAPGTYSLRVSLPAGCATLTNPSVTQAFAVASGEQIMTKDIGCV